jgi:hypothetical protein
MSNFVAKRTQCELCRYGLTWLRSERAWTSFYACGTGVVIGWCRACFRTGPVKRSPKGA